MISWLTGQSWRLWAFLGLALIQIYLPIHWIWQHESALESGRLIHLATRPVDPHDILRGKYVRLSFAAESLRPPLPAYPGARAGQQALAVFTPGKPNPAPEPATDKTTPSAEQPDFWKITRLVELHREPALPETDIYFPVKITGVHKGKISRVSFPFDRYYLREDRAKRAEDLYRRLSRQRGKFAADKVRAWVSLRVQAGKPVIEELYFDGLPVPAYLDSNPE